MSSYSYTITSLPILREGEEKPLTLFRKADGKGESALISTEGAGCVAYLEFPMDGKPRANHFHRIKTEYIYLAKGRLKGCFRPAQRSDLPVEEVEIDAGSLIRIEPLCSHAFVALEDAHAIEWSTEGWEAVRDDVYEDGLI